MILLLDLCYERESLSAYEFVRPIGNALGAWARYDVIHFMDITEDEMEKYERAILCGTALKDNAYAERLESFSWIKGWKKPLLGVCAGMQVIASVFGGRIIPQPAIGLEPIEVIEDSPLLGQRREIEGYHLHNYGVTLPEEFRLLAGRRSRVEAFCHRQQPIYGIIFHPEVRNQWILKRFAELRYQPSR